MAAVFLTVLLPLSAATGNEEDAPGVHGLALHGEPKYPPDFSHFDYVNPKAPKGGTVIREARGSYDSLNGYILRGTKPPGLGMVIDTLMVHADDEPFSVYGLIAERVEVAEDNAWVEFKLREEARFHDGEPITADDVVFSFEVLREHGHPRLRSYYRHVESAEAEGRHRVRFEFAHAGNPELPLIMGELPVLPQHYWEERDFSRTTMQPPLGSGPYRIAEARPGRSITYERVEDYWAEDLPVRRGRFNFDRLRYDFYRDATVALEAFRAGEFDLREEYTARHWATGYETSAQREGRMVLEEIEHSRPAGMQGFVFNTRRPVFEDREVRRALSYAFDFEWTNRQLFHSAYTRTASYFENSELAARGAPGEAEQAILAPFREELPEAVFEPYRPPVTDGSGWNRENLLKALRILKEAGWSVGDDGILRHRDSGRPLVFELLLVNPSFERVALPFVQNLRRIGVLARVRTVDTTQYQYRLDHFEFDMAVVVLPQSPSPGHEQAMYWSSEAADEPGSRNYAGVRDPVVDELVERLVSAEDRDELVHLTRALDRVLLAGHYVIPNWHTPVHRVAYWDKFGRPETAPKYGLGFDTWWVDPDKEQRLREANGPRSVR
ncbi:extracellular solute-binding protein [Halorhodospira halophila]|nr:extracellular solute-binding protein [Halorhodospira halophila]